MKGCKLELVESLFTQALRKESVISISGINRIDTLETPNGTNPISLAAAIEMSIIAPRRYGPRSLMRTIVDLFVLGKLTSTQDPNGKYRCAAVNR